METAHRCPLLAFSPLLYTRPTSAHSKSTKECTLQSRHSDRKWTHSFCVVDGCWVLKLCDFLPRDMIEDAHLTGGQTLLQIHRHIVSCILKIMPSAIGVSTYFFIIAADGQELVARTPGHRLDTQRPFVGAVGGQQPAIQRIQQHLVLWRQTHCPLRPLSD